MFDCISTNDRKMCINSSPFGTNNITKYLGYLEVCANTLEIELESLSRTRVHGLIFPPQDFHILKN